MIDVFVFLPFAHRKKRKYGKTDIDAGSQKDQEIDLCVCGMRSHTHTCVWVHRWA